MKYEIEENTNIQFDFDYAKVINEVIDYCLDYIGCPYEAVVEVLLTDNEEIHKINNEFREKDAPTDVLSFPLLEYEEAGDFEFLEDEMMSAAYFEPESGCLMLGNIVISVEKVKEQAVEYGHSQKRELAFLVAHSMLHLFGFDHMTEDEAAVMEEKQNEILDYLKITRD